MQIIHRLGKTLLFNLVLQMHFSKKFCKKLAEKHLTSIVLRKAPQGDTSPRLGRVRVRETLARHRRSHSGLGKGNGLETLENVAVGAARPRDSTQTNIRSKLKCVFVPKHTWLTVLKSGRPGEPETESEVLCQQRPWGSAAHCLLVCSACCLEPPRRLAGLAPPT